MLDGIITYHPEYALKTGTDCTTVLAVQEVIIDSQAGDSPQEIWTLLWPLGVQQTRS